jgi:hypothetical protein
LRRLIFALIIALVTFVPSNLCAQYIGNMGFIGSGGGDTVARLKPQADYNADLGVWADAAIQLNAPDKSWLECDSNSTLQTGDVDFWWAGWVYFDSKSESMMIVDKRSLADLSTIEYDIQYSSSVDRFRVYLKDGNVVTANTFGSPAVSTWYFISTYHDSVNNVVAISVNGGDFDSAEVVGGTLSGTAPLSIGSYQAVSSYYHDGCIDSLAFGKSPPGGIAAIATTIRDTLYNSGSGLIYDDLTSAQKTAWGLVSFWDFNGPVGGGWVDSHGTNHLTPQFGDIIAPATFGTEKLTNGTLDAWTTGAPDGWTEQNLGTGAIDEETTEVYTAGGSSAKITTGDSASIRFYQTFTTVSGLTYRLSYWTCGDGTHSIRHSVYSNEYLVTITDSEVTGTEWQLITVDFVANTASATIFLTGSATLGAVVYVDDVSLKQYTPGTLNGGFEEWTDVTRTQLVANSGFDSDTTDWTDIRSATSASVAGGVDGNCMELTNGADYGGTHQGITTTVGAVYRLTIWHKNGTGLGIFKIGTTADGSQIYASPSSLNDAAWTRYSVEFVAASTTTYLTAKHYSNTAGRTTLFDSVELVQIASNADDWTESTSGSSLIRRGDEPDDVDDGTHSLVMGVDSNNTAVYIQQASMTTGKLYSVSLYARKDGSAAALLYGSTSDYISTGALTDEFTEYTGTTRAGAEYLYLTRSAATSTSILVDSLTLKAAEILPTGGIARGRAADSNFGISFDGSSDYLSYSGTAFDPGTGDFSIGCAFYVDSLPAVLGTLVSMGRINAATDGVWVTVLANGTIQTQFNDSTAVGTFTSTATVTAGSWNTLVINFDRDGNLTLWINGASENLGVLGHTGSVDPGKFYIGTYSYSPSYYFDGIIDNVFYCDRIVTSDEASYLHNNGEWRQYAEIAEDQPTLAADIVGMWEGDDGDALGTESTGKNSLTGVTAIDPATLSPVLLLDANLGVTESGGKVSAWADQSGNGNDVAQADSDKQPTLVADGVNGEPVLRFDGVDDFLETTLEALPNATIVFVGSINDSRGVVVGTRGSGENRSYVGSNDDDYWSAGVADDSYSVIESDIDPGSPFIGIVAYNGTTVALWHNGNQEYSDAQSGEVLHSYTYAIGANNSSGDIALFAESDIHAIAVFDSFLTDGQRQGVEKFYNDRTAIENYDLTVNGTPTQAQGINYTTGIVSYWEDQAGSLNAANNNLAQRPAFTSIVAGLNNHSALLFDGVDDYLDTGLDGQAVGTIVAVCLVSGADDGIIGVEDTGNRSYLKTTTGPVIAGGVAGHDESTIVSDEDPSSSYVIIAMTYGGDGESEILYVSDVEEYSGTQSGAVSTSEDYAIGAINSGGTIGTHGEVSIARIAIYDKVLTSEEWSTVVSQLQNRYGLAP